MNGVSIELFNMQTPQAAYLGVCVQRMQSVLTLAQNLAAHANKATQGMDIHIVQVYTRLEVTCQWFTYLQCLHNTDIDECLEGSSCDVNADCVNVEGSFGCLCRVGYSRDGTSCRGI